MVQILALVASVGEVLQASDRLTRALCFYKDVVGTAGDSGTSSGGAAGRSRLARLSLSCKGSGGGPACSEAKGQIEMG